LSQPFLIAEIGVNHNGDVDLAIKMIDSAKKAGADAVKFQTFTADALVSHGTPKVPYQERSTSPKESHYEMLRKLELTRKDHIALKSHCEKAGIIFLSTPYDIDSARFLHEKLDVSMFKTASADIVDLPLHRYISSTGKPSIVSVGMATLGEIEEVVDIYKLNKKSSLTLLHCVSNYPCTDESLNLNVMKTLRSAFDVPVGYSDHSVGYIAAVLSIAFGASVIEKHFTIDKNQPGPDHLASSTPEDFTMLALAVRRAEAMLGCTTKKLQEEEQQMALVSRKSIVLKKDLRVGEIVDETHLTLKRPGTGLLSREMDNLIGRKALRDLSSGEQVFYHDIK